MTCENWKYLEVLNLQFKELSDNAENLLEELCQKWNEAKDDDERLNMLNNMLNNISKDKAADSETKRNELIGFIKELKEAKYITTSCLWGSGQCLYSLDSINMSIETYRKRHEEHKESLREVNASNVTNIDNSTHNNLNITGDNNALKDVSVSSDSNN